MGRLVVHGLLDDGSANRVVAVAGNAEKARALAERGAEVRLAAYGEPDAPRTALPGVHRRVLISGSEVGQRAT